MDRKEGKKFLKKINFKNKISAAKEKFLEKLNVPDELAHNLTKITMIENKEILIEGYNNIVDYYDNYIKIQSKNIYIVLDGSNLNINEINDSELLISGNISNIGYLNR
ncbi:MAG: YabP/YqfC family sporulation protein [Clostridia bacterium]|nr:YabP/YqfC family sporulation protein [Clostridia bacterium]